MFMNNDKTKFELVERSSGWWIVGDNGVEHYEPFEEIEDAIEKLNELNLRQKLQNKLEDE
jgi:hypothetical protein